MPLIILGLLGVSVYVFGFLAYYFYLVKSVPKYLDDNDIKDTGGSVLVLAIFIFATAHALVSGGYFPESFTVLFEVLGVGLLGESIFDRDMFNRKN